MKNKVLKLVDFQLEKINKDAQKVIRGGGDEPTDPNNPLKNGGGGNG